MSEIGRREDVLERKIDSQFKSENQAFVLLLRLQL